MVNTVFLSLAGLLAAIAGGLMLWPLLRAGKRGLWGTMVAAMVAATLALYQWVGTPQGLQVQAVAAPQSLEEAVAQLQEALQRQPQRVEGWALLARSQIELGRHAEGAAAYERALQLAPDEPGLLVEAAQARARAHPQMLFDDTGLQWLHRARELEPENQRAQWLVGIVQRQRNQPAEAARTWESLLPKLDDGAANALREQIDAAREAAGMPPLPSAPAGDGHAITVRVTLAPALHERVASGEQTLFVIARIPGGPPMPVAVERHPARAGTTRVTLDDGDSPMPTQKLSALDEVEVFARLSASGSATRQDGDVESAPVRVTLPTDKPLDIVLGAK